MKKLIIGVLTLMIATTGCSSTETLDVDSYLQENNSTINLKDTDDFEGLDLIQDDIKDKKVILTGEAHTLNKDDLFMMKMIKYLQKEIGMNYYLLEWGYSYAYFLNKYLESGDEEILNQVFKNVEGTPGFNRDDYNFFKELYEFNNTLKEEEKIKLVGIDIEHNFGSSYDYIKDTMKDESLSTEALEKTLKSIEDMKQAREENKDEDYIMNVFNDLNASIDVLLDDIESNKDVYKDLFEEDIFGFELVIKNIKTKLIHDECYHDAERYMEVREAQIYENFVLQDEKIDDAIYYGQWGSIHIDKEPLKIPNVISETEIVYVDYEPIAARINNSDKYNDKVMSILYNYSNYEHYSSINEEMFNTYLNSEDDCILFDLGNERSPFIKDLAYPFNENINVDEKYNGKPITDYIDSIVNIKGISQSIELYF